MPLEGREITVPVNIRDLARAGLDRDPDALAIVSADEQVTWRELEERSDGLARHYIGLGLRAGDRVASLMPNRIALAVNYLACFRAGLVATPLNYRYSPREIDHALAASGASILVCHSERAADLAATELVGKLPLGVIGVEGALGDGPTFDDLIASDPGAAALDPSPMSDPAVIFFTSGSTGPAKGVTHTAETLGWMVASAIDALELTNDDAFLPGSSMSHLGGFLWTLASVSVGARVVVARTFDAGEILPLLRAHRPTILAMIPAALTALIRDHDATVDDFSSLRLCRAGADKVSLQLEREFEHLVGFPIDEGYGMTEVGLATLNPPRGPIKVGSIGRVVGGFGISIRDDEYSECASGTVGRVWIRTRSQTVGYWDDPKATAEILRDGWLDSGDLGTRTRTATCGSSAARSRSSCTTARTSALRKWKTCSRSTRGGARRCGRDPRRSARGERARVRHHQGGRGASHGARPHRVRTAARRVQGTRGSGVPRRDAAQPHRQDRPRRAEEHGRRPSAPARTPGLSEASCPSGTSVRGGRASGYRDDLFAGRLAVTVDDVEAQLRGRDVAGYCPLTDACHDDILLAVANE